MRYLKLGLIFIVALAGFVLLLNIRPVVGVVSARFTDATSREGRLPSPSSEEGNIPGLKTEAMEEALDNPGISLKEVDAIDKKLKQQYSQSLHPYVYRVQALRAVLLCLMAHSHSASSLNSLIVLYGDNLSPEQRQILLTYKAGGKKTEDRWMRQGGISSLADFDKLVNYE